jgi:uncharacterized protein (DUF362 family)
MTMVNVSVVRTEDAAEGVRRALELLDLDLAIHGSRVLVKPNLCSPFPVDETPSNTDPAVVAGVIRYFRDRGAQRVLVGDEPVWGLTARFCYARSGVEDAVTREGGELVCFDEGTRITRAVPHGRIFESVSLPAILDEVDLFVNVPKMKTSSMTLVTLCVKNLFGLIPFRARKQFHRGVDLCYALIDIAKAAPPHLNLIDGTVAMEGMGAHSGTPYPLGVLVASRDLVAADIVGTRVMGFDPLEPITTQLALKDRLGVEHPDQIAVLGERVEEVAVRMRRPVFRLVHPKENVEVIPGGICPGCMTRVPRIPPTPEPDKRYAVLLGRRVRFPRHEAFDEIWCFGDCGIAEGRKIARQFPDLKGRMREVRGCPPLDWWRDHTMGKELESRGWM